MYVASTSIDWKSKRDLSKSLVVIYISRVSSNLIVVVIIYSTFIYVKIY